MAKELNNASSPLSPVGAKLFGADAAGNAGWLSGFGAVVSLSPSGDDAFVHDTAAIQGAIDGLYALGGGVVTLNTGDWYAKDITLKSGVSVVGVALPRLVPIAVCPDLGMDAANPFPGGVVFRGTVGDEIVFKANTSDLPAPASDAYNAADVAVTGVKLSCLCADGVASLLTCGGANHSGLAFSVLEFLFGNDIQGTFVDLVNPQHVNGRMIKAFSANHLLRVGAYHAACQPGNSYFNDLYLYSWAEPNGTYVGKNTSWGIKLDTRSAGTSVGGGPLNFVTLGGRIQVNGFRDAELNRSRGNACIVCEGASSSLPVNSCNLLGLDLEGRWSYGVKLTNCTNCRVCVDGVADAVSMVATLKVKTSSNVLVESPILQFTVWIDIQSSVFLSGFIRYYSRDENEVGSERSQVAKGIYTVYAKYSSGTTSPVYTPIKTNGATYLQLGVSNSYGIELSESEHVLRRTFTPIAENISSQTANKTWNRWEACVCKLSTTPTTQTLPVIDSKIDGVVFTFKSIDASSHIIQGQSGQTIDGSATYALAGNNSVRLIADGVTKTWWVI